MKKIIKLILKIFVCLIALYILLSMLLYVYPQMFLYLPSGKTPNIEAARKAGYPANLVRYNSEDGTELFAWYTEPEGEHKGKIIVFFHGNAMNVEAFYNKVEPFHRYGYATFMPEYRGFSGIKGKITDKNLRMDAIAALNKLYSLGYTNENIIIYGFSLGSHMAISTVYTLKEKGKFDALVLEVPFNTIPDVAKAISPVYMPFDTLINDKYDNVSLIPYVDTRVLIMATKADNIVPYHLAEDLYEHAVAPKDIVIYDKGIGHNDLYYVGNYVLIKKWLEDR